MNPESDPAAILVGVCLEKQGRIQEALQHYLKATGEKSGFRSTGLYCAAVCYKELGDNASALELLKLQKESSPIENWTIKGVALKGEIEGLSQQQIDQSVAFERVAADLYRQARDLARETHYKSPEALPLFDQVLTEYPGTGGAYCALTQKAELLWHLSKREEVCKCYEQLREILRGQTPCERVRLMLRTMDCRIGQHRAQWLFRVIAGELNTGKDVKPEEWERLRVLWDRWHHNSNTPAEADAFWMMVLYRQKRFAEVVSAAEEFWGQYFEKDPDRILDPVHKQKLTEVYLMKGHALDELGRYEEALESCRAAVALGETTPPLLIWAADSSRRVFPDLQDAQKL